MTIEPTNQYVLTNLSLRHTGAVLARLILRCSDFVRKRLSRIMTSDDPRYHINTIAFDVKMEDSELGGKCYISAGCGLYGKVKIGFASTLGPRCMLYGNKGSITIGKFTQLGPEVSIFGNNHPLSFLTTYVNQNLFSGRLASHAPARPVNIGHDVWIGQSAIVLNGVTIGNGAAIGGGSIVVHDVPAYAIAAGNPAKILRYRFPPDIVELLERLRWWDLEMSTLDRIESLFHVDFSENPEAFRNGIIEAIRQLRSQDLG